LLPVEVI